MDFPKHYCYIKYYKVHLAKFLNYDVFMSLKFVFMLANSADPDEMPPYAAFHLGRHCLPKYLFTRVQSEQGT